MDDLDATQPFFTTSSPIPPEQNLDAIVSPDRPSASFQSPNQSPVKSPPKKRPCDSLASFTQMGCKTYDTRCFASSDVAELLLKKGNIRTEKVCKTVPPGPLNQGQFTFVLDLNSVQSSDLSVDALGKYNKPSQRKFYYQVKGERSYISLGCRKPNKEYNVFMRVNRYSHAGAGDGPNQFVKQIFTVHNAGDNSYFSPFAVIVYSAGMSPRKLKAVAHGNSKDQEKPLQRTKPSVLKHARNLFPSHTPKEVNQELLQVAGGAANVSTPMSVPPKMRQLYDQSYRHVPNSKRSTAAGRPKNADYDEILKMKTMPGSFVVDVHLTSVPRAQLAPGRTCDVQILLADHRSLEIFKSACLTSSAATRCQPLQVDMTYNCCKGLYVTPFITRDMRFIDENNSFPITPICFLLSNRKTGDTYEWAGRALVKAAGLSDTDAVRGLVSDQEPGLKFLTHIEQFKPGKCAHVYCELHLKKGTDNQLSKFGKEVQESITKEIYGWQYRTTEGKLTRRKGLVDCGSEFEFRVNTSKLMKEWNEKAPGFYEWFMGNTGVSIQEHYLLPLRKQLGEGALEGRITTNDIERFNGIIQTYIDHCVLAPQELIRKLEKYDYVSYDLLCQDPGLVLQDGHRHHLLEQFGINSFPDAQTDWRDNPVSPKPRRGTM